VKHEALTRWTCDHSADLYGIRNWGAEYFDINEDGDVVVRPHGARSDVTVSLPSVVAGLKDRNLTLPVLLRFSDVIASQIGKISGSFQKAIRDLGYKGRYRGVYPIKVNQQQDVVDDVTESGREFHHGLEAGSKAELIAATSYLKDPEALLICNGYKDEEFIDLALYAQKMGLHAIIVVETPGELPLILDRAARLAVKPRLGVRAKLSSRAGGHWDSSGGDRSKFGLDASQIMDAIQTLRKRRMLGSLEMLHYHLGSQVSDIRRVRTAVREASRFYVELVREGARLRLLNVGGGLAVDYDGSHTNFASSRNYSIEEYAADVIEVVMNTADEAGVSHPVIVSESGRATVAHHSVLIFNVLGVRRFEPREIPRKLPPDSSEMLRNLMEVRATLTPRNVQEAYHDAVYYRDEVRSGFLHGDISLRERALAETIFWDIVFRIFKAVRSRKYVPDEMEGLEQAIADVYCGNFSLFQSLPDSWAIDQLFPIMPIHRLNEMPTRQAVLADITCDSDGKIDTFIDLHDVKRVLPLHEIGDGEYYLGAFLVGAYQETLGDMHNLLGHTNVLHVRVGETGQIEYAREIAGDTVEEALTYVEYNPRAIIQRIRGTAERAVQSKKITASEKGRILEAYETGMRGYTYFER
jgi:arginine decarboxylase